MTKISVIFAVFIFLFPVKVFAEKGDINFGNWNANTTNKKYYYAYTQNNNNNAFGLYCYKNLGQCMYLISIDSTCTKEHKYPVVINTETGAFDDVITCINTSIGQSVYGFTFDVMDKYIPTKGKMAIAVPMGDDRFKAVYFRADGSSKAMQHIINKFKKYSKDNTKSTKNF